MDNKTLSPIFSDCIFGKLIKKYQNKPNREQLAKRFDGPILGCPIGDSPEDDDNSSEESNA